MSKRREKKTAPRLISPEFPAWFAGGLLKARAINDGEPKFSVMLVLDDDDPWWNELEEALEDALEEEFGEIPRGARKDWPIRDPEDLDDPDPALDGKKFCRPRSKIRPEIIDVEGEIVPPDEVYSGMICRVAVHPFAWHHKKTNRKGVSLTLDSVMKVGEGERLGGRSDAASDFERYIEGGDGGTRRRGGKRRRPRDEDDEDDRSSRRRGGKRRRPRDEDDDENESRSRRRSRRSRRDRDDDDEEED